MSRGKVKIKKIVPKNSGDSELLNDMFSQMTGAENADTDIIIPKFCKLIELIKKYSRVYQMLLNFSEFIDNFPDCNDNFDEIKAFIVSLDKLLNDNLITEQSLRNSSVNDVNILYKKFKNSKEVQSIVITSGNLGKYRRYLENAENLGDEFIKREPGLSLKPLSFSNIDLKLLWVSDKLGTMAKKYILSIISHTYLIGHNIYQIITSPDIDIKKFSRVLIDNIDKMKKQIPRCNKAFDIIAQSVNMLETKFDSYYKTSVEAENPSIIIESFIVDVSLSQKANASVTSQFRKIIMFMKRQSANNKDPRVSKLFKILNNQFSMMQRETGVEADSEDDENKTSETQNEEPDKDQNEETNEEPGGEYENTEDATEETQEETQEETPENDDVMDTVNDLLKSMTA